jgi:hypothetical protein
MSLAIKIPDTLEKVKDALTIWAAWMERDNTKLGYGHVTGFQSGGSVSSWEDFERKVENNLAINVNAILEDLPLHQQHAVFHFHIAAVFTPRRTRIEDDYADAVDVLAVALNRRGLL